ncbi:MAG: SDR family oxidoreductase [Fidelibacterota bacterium]|nr:MAG: SDR family oxidoreductase [Candidatus Neomarinimicrobiota bacterium]
MEDSPQRVIVTGASSGIGRELARQLAARGARVALGARREQELMEVAKECDELGGEALAILTDVSAQNQCKALIEQAVQAWGGIDMLINNAGISMHARFEDISDLGIYERIMRVNYLGAVACTHYALPYLKASRGRIVVISSLAGKTGVPTRTGYSASKHALHGFFDALRVELSGSGVSITIICPGYVATGIRRYIVGPDGRPENRSYQNETRFASVASCAGTILQSAERRKREVVMTATGKAGQFVKLFFPGLIDRIAQKKVRLRTQQGRTLSGEAGQ